MKSNRRNFLKTAGIAGLSLTGIDSIANNNSFITSKTDPDEGMGFVKRSKEMESSHVQRFNMSGFAAPKLTKVRVGVIGLGNRGPGHMKNLSRIQNVEIKALCDIRPEKAEQAKKMLEGTGHNPTLYSGHENEWKKLCERDDIDLVVVVSPWYMHAAMAIYAMEQGKHAVSEVALAATIDECWQLVKTAEKTRKHCMMLANYCYNQFELTILNMARQGFFGEIVHGEGGYIANKVGNNFRKNFYWDMWWLEQYANHKGNIYPIHGFEIICQMMDINRGDKLNRLVSVESGDFIMGKMANELAAKDDSYSEFKDKNFRGNINTSVIKTAKGRTIVVQHDASTYRPYTLKHEIYGMEASVEGYPQPARIYKKEGGYVSPEEYKSITERYKPGVLKRDDLVNQKTNSEFGADMLMMWRLIDCLRNGLPLDMDVYDGVSMSSVLPLSEWSVNNGSQPIDIPDFTAGSWKTNERNMSIINL
jgi:predicted dehydrogenase